MTPKLSQELDQAVRQQGSPLHVTGADEQTMYVIITGEQFDRLYALFNQDPPSVEEQQELLRQAGKRAGWDDPEMDAYDNYDANRPA